MRIQITYRRINILFAIVVAINLANFAVSKFNWPTLPAFPALIDGHPALSLLVQAVVVIVGVVLYAWLRPKREKAAMVAYVLAVGSGLAALFEGLDILLGAIRRS